MTSRLFDVELPEWIMDSLELPTLWRLEQAGGWDVYRGTFVERDLMKRGLIEPMYGGGAFDVTVGGLTRRVYHRSIWYASRLTVAGQKKLNDARAKSAALTSH